MTRGRTQPLDWDGSMGPSAAVGATQKGHFLNSHVLQSQQDFGTATPLRPDLPSSLTHTHTHTHAHMTPHRADLPSSLAHTHTHTHTHTTLPRADLPSCHTHTHTHTRVFCSEHHCKSVPPPRLRSRAVSTAQGRLPPRDSAAPSRQQPLLCSPFLKAVVSRMPHKRTRADGTLLLGILPRNPACWAVVGTNSPLLGIE